MFAKSPYIRVVHGKSETLQIWDFTVNKKLKNPRLKETHMNETSRLVTK